MDWLLILLAAVALMGVCVFMLMRKDRSALLMVAIERGHERLDRMIRDEMSHIRSEEAENSRQTRHDMTHELKEMKESLETEVTRELKEFKDSVDKKVTEQIFEQRNNLDSFSMRIGQITKISEDRIEQVKKTVEEKLQQIQEDNAKNIEVVRLTVDEKLQGTLERRLGESFRQVSERLEQVHQGLGDMRNLAAGVGDLKKIFSNVKLRGTWGEVQLESLLNEILSPEQYEKNVRTGGQSNDMVEFAIRLPGNGDSGEEVLLPIDAKFPLEDYLRMAEAQERGDGDKTQEASRALETRIKTAAKNIAAKYLHPPKTTDFAILYLPVEGLYAEIVRRPDLTGFLQREHRILVAGPSTFAALLNSLQIGFRTIAIQKRTSEVWQVLAAVKAEFGKFGGTLEGVRKKLEQAANTMDDALKRSRVIERKLHHVQEGGIIFAEEGTEEVPPPAAKTEPLFALPAEDEVKQESPVESSAPATEAEKTEPLFSLPSADEVKQDLPAESPVPATETEKTEPLFSLPPA
ncbi:MAG: DNA recombination protein RmuC, partial [Syntrophobacterales bacterium]|nr:DNA recombination protein RmuC [Syntrophobacterales bacterium]